MRLLSALSGRSNGARSTSPVFFLLVCFAALLADAKGKDPTLHHTYFKTPLSKLVYFKSPTTILGLDKTTNSGRVFRSADSGEHWGEIAAITKASRLYAHPHDPLTAYALSEGSEHWVTHDEGKTWSGFSTPGAPTTAPGERPLAFHAERAGWILFFAEKCKEETGGWWPFPRMVCHDEAYYTKDGFDQAAKDYKAGDRAGSAITALLGDGKPVAKCLWARQTKEFEAMAEAAIFCLEIVPESEAAENKRSLGRKRSLAGDIAGILDKQTPRSTVQLTASEDFFSTKRTVHFGSGNDGAGGDRAGGGVVAVSVVKNYVMAAISHAHSNEMDLFVSMDGHTWAESRLPLPPGAEEDAYTILESTAHSVLVDVQTSSAGALGTLFRSNSNGTYYTASLEHTHRAASGLVDVERVHGVEGVIIANQVANWEQIGRGIGGILHREKLELKSRISFNDGARWHFLQPPKKDLDGKAFGCSRDGWETGQCALHLHSVTSTRTPGRVFGSPSAAGVILAVGNVGSQLSPWRECDTFLSRDGGITWKMVHREAHHVQLADSGSVLVLANDEVPTDVLAYSLDSGDTWTNAALDQKMRVSALFIDDDGLSPVVLAVGTAREGAHNHEQVVVSVDFAKSLSRQCSLDPKDPKAGKDTELFVMSSHDDDDCIMGHRSEHIRRKPSADCFMRLDQVL
ncbi:vacuolar protein sorting/targeting protein PEP1, partial [Kickxella alabastrina]